MKVSYEEELATCFGLQRGGGSGNGTVLSVRVKGNAGQPLNDIKGVSDGLNFCQLLTQSLVEFLSFSVDWFALLGGQPPSPRDKMRHRSGVQ